ncbi:glycosyltransferase [Solidesulfovibrio sp.]
MRIVCCNKYFFVNGGTEQYLFRILNRLPRFGCEAIPFSVAYAGSAPSPYAGYFLPPPGNPGQTHFNTLGQGFGALAALPRLLGRAVWSLEAKRALHHLLDDLGPVDIGYILNIYNYMSPSVITVFKERGIPVVMRLGDYHLLCLNYQLLHDNRPCQRCLAGGYWQGMVRRCVKGSLPASLVRGAAMYFQRMVGVYDQVDAFVAPCSFMRDKLVAGGFPAGRIHVIRQGVETDAPPPTGEKGDYILYFGRLSSEKGLDTLLEAYQNLAPDADLVLAGRGQDDYETYLKSLVRPDYTRRIRFAGFVAGPALSGLVARALLSVTPSRWYDNAPLAVLESAVLGTPVLAAAIGGIPELVEDGITGRLFAPDSVTDLTAKLAAMLADRASLATMGQAARQRALDSSSLDTHLTQLVALFETLRLASRQ